MHRIDQPCVEKHIENKESYFDKLLHKRDLRFKVNQVLQFKVIKFLIGLIPRKQWSTFIGSTLENRDFNKAILLIGIGNSYSTKIKSNQNSLS